MTAEVLAVDGFGYAPPPYTADAASLQGAWQPVSLPHAVAPRRVEAVLEYDPDKPPTVVEWYRIAVPVLGRAAEPRYLYLPRWKTDGQLAVYADGRKLWQSQAGMAWNGWNIPLFIPLDATADAAPPRLLLLRVERPRFSGGGISSLWLGEEDALKWRYYLRELIQVQLPAMSGAAFLAVGLFSLAVWLRERSQPLYLLFFLVSLASFLRSLHFYVGDERLPIPEDWFSWLTVNSLFWMVAVVHFFLNHLHGHPWPWLNRIVLVTTLGIGIATLPLNTVLPDVYTLSSLAYVPLLAMGTIVSLVGWRRSRRHGSLDGIMLSAWGCLGMGFGIYDWLLQNNFMSIESIYLGPYSNILAFLIFLHIVYRRYVGAIDAARQANAILEERLRAREAELAKSYRALREVEQRQLLEQERRRLMQDMHDGLGSSLESALRVVERGKLGEAELAELLQSCIDDLKLTIDSMETTEADLLLLLATLRFRLAPRLEASDIALRWEVRDVPGLNWLTSQHSLHILRILQEVFTNIVKHSEATEIRVTTGSEDDGVTVTVIDNGRGFDPAQAAQGGGRGLTNQQRRAQSIGAEVRYRPACPGTAFTLWLPR